ncbi:SU10 major capsid protein [Bacillus bombysepticus]|uniref:SU10 major capsid protein n=1 Tax=Paenibacillus dendritiformis TaxID=130049 RepID=UPI00387E1C56
MTKVYNEDLVGKKESVVDEFLLLNPLQTPMINLLGFGQAVTAVEHIWFEDEMFAQEAKATAAAEAAATSITVDSAEAFRPLLVVKAGDELMLVTKVEVNKITVTRGYAGTTAGDVAEGDVIEAMFVEGVEGADARDARYKPRKRVSNITQIFDESVELTGTAMAVAQHGVDNEYEKEKQKKQVELALQLEKAVINGIRYEQGQKRMMRGIRSFIESNVQNVGGLKLRDEHLVNAFRAIFEKGGFNAGGNYKIIVGATQKIAISNFDKAQIRLSRQENTRGQVVDHYVSDFGAAEIVLNNNLPANEILIIDANRITIRPLVTREFSHEFLGKKGDYMKGMLVGEYTLEMLQEAAHAKIVGLGDLEELPTAPATRKAASK